MLPLPKTIQEDFSEHHIKLVWEELHDRFGFNIEGWKKRFRSEMSRQPRNVTDVDYFFIFANRSINPILNEILCRPSIHPTLNKLVEYVMNKH